MAAKTSDRPVLKVEKRKLLGSKVKSLRKQGILPANIYGRKVKSLAVKGDFKEIKKIFNRVGETGLVNLTVKGEKAPRAVLLHGPQLNPTTDQLIHLDFRQADLTQKITADVPIGVDGESPAVNHGQGVLVQLLQEIEVEALPTDLPERLTVNISSLKEVDQGITVAQLIKSSEINTKKVTVKTGNDQLVVKIEPPTKEEEIVPEEVPVEEGVTPEGDTPEGEAEAKPETTEEGAGKKEAPKGQEKTKKKEKKKN